jgi:phospholipid-binding lipoprotein MlaA
MLYNEKAQLTIKVLFMNLLSSTRFIHHPLRVAALMMMVGMAGFMLTIHDACADEPNKTQTHVADLKPMPTYNAQDPFEQTNRKIFGFNMWVDRHLIRPVTLTYHALVPNSIRGAIGGVFAELAYPSVIVNDVLQGSAQDATQDLARFIVNGTVGLAGTWDPATRFGLSSHKRDFGQTLGKYGVPMGPYIMLPIIGPETGRDLPAELVDRFTSLDWHVKQSSTKYSLTVGRLVSRRDELLPADAAIDNAYDPYLSVRDAYIQKRAYMAKENTDDAADDDLPSLDDLDPDHPPNQHP